MKWQDKKEININYYKDICRFFNSPASDFYAGSFYFSNSVDFTNRIKADLLYFIEEFERVIKGSFNSSIYLNDIDINLFKKMYPNFCNNLFYINDTSSVKTVGEMLNIFRRANAHSIPSKDDIKYLKRFDANIYGLKSQKVFNSEIKYVTNSGELTFAGLVFIILNLGREQSIETLVRKNRIFGLVSNGKIEEDDGSLFVSEISKVNLTYPIREDDSELVLTAVVGKLLSKCVSYLDHRYVYESFAGNEIYQYKIDAIITDTNIFIKRGCLTSVYYEEDYELEIEDKKHFIELANLFPPFVFVDLLYKLDIHLFDNVVYKFIKEEKKWEGFSKLRYPKFYIDKNIDILLADKKHADIRVNSSVCNGSLVAIFLRLEKSLIKYGHINIGNFEYSIIHKLLEQVGCPKELCDKTRLLRNLVFHSSIIGEYCVSTSGVYQFTFENIIDYLKELIIFFKHNNQPEIYETLRNDVSNIFIASILSIRTKLFSRETVKFLKSYPEINNLSDLRVKRNFYDNTSYDIKIFNSLNAIVYGNPRILIFSLKEVEFELLIYMNYANLETFNEFIERNGFVVIEDQAIGIVRKVKLAKK